MAMFKFKIGLACWLLVAASAAMAEPFAQDDLSWLNKMVFSARHADYSGTFIYQSGSYVEISRITHLLEGGNEYERLESLDGERSEIIRKNDQVWCYQGDKQLMVANRAGVRTFPALLPEQLSLLQENYLIRHAEDARVAGFPAHGIIFQPRDKLRYSHQMWAHSDSGLLLKSVVLDEHDHIIEQYAFTQLNMGGDIERKWIVTHKSTEQSAAGKAISRPNLHTIPKESGWVVYALPAGFKKMTEVSRFLKGSQLPVTHLVYSDGLAGISVFVEKLGDKPVANTGLYSKGVIQVFTKVLDANLLTVVGEVPARTVMQVAESVRYGGLPK
jgi:sigma-E factor negative regulatory protein RseB